MITKPDKGHVRKLNIKLPVNTDAKILVNQIQEYIIKIMHHDKFRLFWGYKTDWNLRINYCNNSLYQQTKKEKKHISIHAEETFDKIQYLLMVAKKSSQRTRNRKGTFELGSVCLQILAFWLEIQSGLSPLAQRLQLSNLEQRFHPTPRRNLFDTHCTIKI